MAQEELHFLRDQVQRLNLLLAKYQHGDETQLSREAGDVPMQMPWLYERAFLAPIIEEYDKLIEDFNKELSQERAQLRSVKGQAERLVGENERLTRQLKEQVQQGLQDVDLDRLRLTDDHLQDNLQGQLADALKEKDATVELWQGALAEVDRLEAELRRRDQHPQAQALEEQAEQLRAQYFRAVSGLNEEIAALKESLRVAQEELRVTKSRATELDRKCSEAAAAERRLKERLDGAESGSQTRDRRVHELEERNAKLSESANELRRKLASSDRECRETEERRKELEEKYKGLEEQTYQAMCQMKESIAMAENALMEKDAAIVRERQKEEDCERLQQAISKLVDEAGARTRDEVELVRQQANQSISKVLEELNAAEMARMEQNSEMERLTRDKRRAEEELDRLHREGLVAGSQELTRAEELNRQLLSAQREREEQRLQLETLRVGQERAAQNWSCERAQLQADCEKLRERVATLQRSYERSNADCQKYAARLEEAESRAQAARQEAQKEERRVGQEAALREQEAVLREQELKSRLESQSDLQRRAQAELRQMLTAQIKVSNRWKTECHAIAARFEEKLNQVKEEAERHKHRSDDLNALLAEARVTLEQREATIADYAATVRRLTDRKNVRR